MASRFLPAIRLLWAMVGVLVPSLSWAQSSASATPQQAVTFRSDRIPIGFTGPSLDALISDLLSRGSPLKGPFESTAEFRERRRKELNAPLPDGLPASAERVFVLNGPVYLSYDADRRRATWPQFGRHNVGECRRSSAVSSEIAAVTGERQMAFMICELNMSDYRNTYIARTRLNVLFEVHRRETTSQSLTLCSIREGSRDDCDQLFATRHIPMAPDRAMRLFPQSGGTLRMAVAGRPVEPYVVQATDRSGRPSLDVPIDNTFNTTTLRLQVTGILLFDSETGEVVMRIPAAASAGLAPPQRRRN